ncbi:uncharacterized protein LOC110731049 [Chenopodium quinoa]|uniref:uncharacterized protein LOC110731049 n=1 Tax=Chenopodium quinoa TaxID=63459 RepID=UPI000B77B9CB|nr:uncharacterized protein LOC110731049 [Chenopodium quinoa]
MASKISLSVVPKNDSYDEEKTRIMELPKELLTDIICRLPISSLYNMKPLLLHNKEFHSIISDPKFPQFYQTYDNIHPCSFIAYTSSLYDTRMSLIEYDSNRNDFIITRLNMEFVPAFSRKDMMMLQRIEVLASCNGLFLVRLWRYDEHYYYNARAETFMFLVDPINRRYLTIPQIIELSTTRSLERYAFGYVPKIGKYKVVRFLEKSYEILTINNNNKFECTNWRKRIITHDHPLYREYTENDTIHKFKNPVVWEGSLYCLVDRDTKILKLDMEKEELELVFTPSVMLESSFYVGSLGVLGESLYIAINRFGDENVEVWMMEESWRKAFVIGESQCNKFDYPFKIIRVYDDGKILIYSSNSRKLYLLDPKDERSEEKSIEIQGMGFMDDIKFVPSFLPLKHV